MHGVDDPSPYAPSAGARSGAADRHDLDRRPGEEHHRGTGVHDPAARVLHYGRAGLSLRLAETRQDARVILWRVHIDDEAIMRGFMDEHLVRMLDDQLATPGIDMSADDFGGIAGGKSHGVTALSLEHGNQDRPARHSGESVHHFPIVSGFQHHLI